MSLPVSVEIGSLDALRPGEPATVKVHVKAGADVAFAKFRLTPSTGWSILDGSSHWAGALKAGQELEFQFRAVPLSEQPESLRAVVESPGLGEVSSSLDAERMGGKHPENGTADADPATPIEAGTDAKPQPDRSTVVAVTATGRFTYFDDQGIRRGVRNAKVELLNLDPVPLVCRTGSTDGAGNFSLTTSSCGNIVNLFDGPDLRVRIVLDNDFVQVRDDALGAQAYSAQTGVVNNFSGGTVNFGQITINSNQRAYHAHNIVMRAKQFMDNVNETMPKVTVLWPADATFYVPVLGEIRIDNTTRGNPFAEEGDVYHEYGHHILFSKTDFVVVNYGNGIGDDGSCQGASEADLPFEGGHCLWLPEIGNISWVEGWPDYFAAFLLATHNAADGYLPTGKYSFETRPILDDLAGFEDHIEGFIAAILWDLTDSENDDQEVQGSGRRDRIDLSFANIWDAIKNFDPSSNSLHNHPQNIHEFWDALRARRLGDINRISEVYGEHNIVKPQPDLRVTTVQNPPTVLNRGVTFSINTTISNAGNELANSGFPVLHAMRPVNVGPGVNVGQRSVPAGLAAGAGNTAATSLTIPATMNPGTYRLQVCVDIGFQFVPESDESNNCRDANVTTVIQ